MYTSGEGTHLLALLGRCFLCEQLLCARQDQGSPPQHVPNLQMGRLRPRRTRRKSWAKMEPRVPTSASPASPLCCPQGTSQSAPWESPVVFSHHWSQSAVRSFSYHVKGLY